MSKPLSRKERTLQDTRTIYQVNIVKFITLLTLRNQGWGKKRLTRFSNSFDEIFRDINLERLSFTDIMLTIQQETGIAPKEFVMEVKRPSSIHKKRT